MLKRWKYRLLAIAIALMVVFLAVVPVNAADRVYFNYGPLEFSVPVESLATFAEAGKVDPALGFFLNRLSAGQQQGIRGFLRTRFPLSPAIVSRVMYSATGVRLLTRIGDLIETPSGLNGLYAIRAAVAEAATDPQGLTAVNFLQKFPTNVRLNTTRILSFVGEALAIVRRTNAVVAQLEQQTSADAATQQAIDFSQFPNLKQPGELRVTQRTLNLRDADRDRAIPTDLYLPESNQTQLPLLIFSNGLGANRDRYALLAQHLASHGFAIAVPDHVGSNDDRQKAFFAGLYRENFDATEFIDRPLDVTFVLNELEKRNATEFNNQLNLQRVGMFGYSFGGTTALSLAGAELNFEQIEKNCTPPIDVLDISTLYQCRALELPRQPYHLQDDRIQAAFIYVPFGRTLFASGGLDRVNIPILWQAADEDIVDPLVLEQIPFFAGLKNHDRYLAVTKGLPHTRVTVQLLDRIMHTNRSADLDRLTTVAQNYLNALNLAFFKVYITGDQEYCRYLQAVYANALTEPPYSLSFVRSTANLTLDR